MGSPLRLVFVIIGPILWVVLDILPDIVQFIFVATDPFVIIALPESTGKWWPMVLFDAVDVRIGGHRFKPLNHPR